MLLDGLREANRERQLEWDPKNRITLTFSAVELAGEVGEACNIVKKMEREKMGLPGSRATRDQLAEELADIIICTDLLALRAGINLEDAVVRKFNAVSKKLGLKTLL